MEKNRLQEIKKTFVFLTIMVFVAVVLVAGVLHEPGGYSPESYYMGSALYGLPF